MADRPHTDQCECLRPAPERAKENSTGPGVGREQLVILHLTNQSPGLYLGPRGEWPKLVVPILRDERLKLMENSFSTTS